MISATQIVQIDRHELAEGLVALSFVDPHGEKSPPLVFVLHGLGSRKERHLDLCLRLARAGYRVCALDVRLHGERQTAESEVLWGDRTSLPFVLAFGKTAIGTVTDIAALATYFGAATYGMIGHSMGGYIASLTALADKRAIAVVNVSGSIEAQLAPEIIAQMPPDGLLSLAALNLVERGAEFAPVAILLVHGVQDETVPVEWARHLYAALQPAYAQTPDRAALRELPEIGHEFIPEEAEIAIEWLKRFLA